MSAREVIARALSWGRACDADAILAALDAAGLAVVPVEPTEAVKEAGVNAMASLEYIAANEHEAQHIYRAMLAAAAKEGER
jgi:hypothetical protein